MPPPAPLVVDATDVEVALVVAPLVEDTVLLAELVELAEVVEVVAPLPPLPPPLSLSLHAAPETTVSSAPAGAAERRKDVIARRNMGAR